MESRESGKRLFDLYRALRDEESFSMAEKVLLFELLAYMNDNLECYPGQALLMRKLKATDKTLTKHFNSLQEKGAVAIAKKHGKGGCTVYKILWAEKIIAEMSPKPVKKAGKQYQPFSHHDNSHEDSAVSVTVTTDEQSYDETQDESSNDNQWYEEVAFDIERGANSPPPLLPTEEEQERIFQQWWEERQASGTRLSVNIFKSRALAHYCKEEEVQHYYQLYLQKHDIPQELKNRR